MAAFDTTRPADVMSFSRAKRAFNEVVARVAAWNDERMTVKSLSRLSARELEDIGLTRGDIATAARIR